MKFVGGIYDFNKLNSIRHFSKAYFHGHSVGGTNPSLLEAMASECFILAHDIILNRAVLKDNSLYYPNAEKVTEMLNDIENICTQHKKNFTDGTALYQVWAFYTTRNGKEIFLEDMEKYAFRAILSCRGTE